LTKMLGTRTREAADDVYAMYVQATWVLYHHFLCKAFCTFMFWLDSDLYSSFGSITFCI
jgi:hypothetical protein